MVEHPFELDVAGRLVPGILWAPLSARGPRPLVLVGHGATGNKRSDYVLAVARQLVRHNDFAVASIDGPGHGERCRPDRTDEISVFSDFLAEWSRPGTTDDVVTEWSSVINELQKLEFVGTAPVGYWGLSMGTIYGIPLAAADRRISVGVFGLMGQVGPTSARLAHDATRLSCPVLFLVQWNDSLIPREHCFELFDAIASPDKRLHAQPGEHSSVPPEEVEFSTRFLVSHLGRAHAGDRLSGD